MLIWIVLMTVMANNFYFGGKLAWKLLIFKLIMKYLGPLGMRRIALNKQFWIPLAWIWIDIITGYIFAPGMKNVTPPFLHFLGFWGLLSPGPLVKCECIYFCAKVCIWIDLWEKYGTNFGLMINYKKMLIFRLKITDFGTLRMHQIASILSKHFRGSMPRTPLAQVIINNHNRATYASAM